MMNNILCILTLLVIILLCYNKNSINISLFILIIILYVLMWNYNLEEFRNITDEDQQSLYPILTSNCNPNNCNLNVWSHKKIIIPDDYEASNYSTSAGCCIVPSKYKIELSKRFGNAA